MHARTAPTTPLEPSPEHDRLRALVGAWRGRARTWAGPPGVTPVEADWTGEIFPLLGGRYVGFDYASSFDGQPLAGLLLLGYHRTERAWTSAWIDSFHTGNDILRSEATAGADAISMRTTYSAGPGEPRWGWRTDVALEGPDRLAIRMYNATPAGEEMLGVEILLERA